MKTSSISSCEGFSIESRKLGKDGLFDEGGTYYEGTF